MNQRSLVVVIALVLAAAAAVAVYLYVDGIRDSTESESAPITVIVSQQDIPAGAVLDDLIAQGAFTESTVAENDLVTGAVTSLDQLAGETSSAAIIAGEQIPVARLQSSSSLPGGTLGIPEGYQAVTLALDNPRSVGGNAIPGDRVTIYATVDPGDGARTLVLVPEARVLRTGGEGRTLLTVALRPSDAQRVVFAGEQGSVWFSLLPPDQKGVPGRPITVGDLAR